MRRIRNYACALYNKCKNSAVIQGLCSGSMWAVGLAAATRITFAAFIRMPILVVGIAMIPVEKWIAKQWKLTPVMHAVLSFALFAGLMTISWHAGEIVIALAVCALVAEFYELRDIVSSRINQVRTAYVVAE